MPISSVVKLIDGVPIELCESGGHYEVHLHSASGAVYLGTSDVTTATGYKLDNGEKITVTCPDGDALYAISNGGSQTVYVLKVAL